MKGAAEEVAAKLEKHLPGYLATCLKKALQQSKARPVEHEVMGVILGVLADRRGPHVFLEQLRTKHLQGLSCLWDMPQPTCSLLIMKELFWSCGRTRSVFCGVLAQAHILA